MVYIAQYYLLRWRFILPVAPAARRRRPEGRTPGDGTKSPVVSPSVHHLDTCQTALGSDRAISAILGVSPSQVSRWRRGQLPDLDNADRLAGLALVTEMLTRWLHRDAVEGWLHGVHAHLGDRSPAYMIGQGRVADVVGAIEAEKAGVFA